jgi:hypothetical protein
VPAPDDVVEAQELPSGVLERGTDARHDVIVAADELVVVLVAIDLAGRMATPLRGADGGVLGRAAPPPSPAAGVRDHVIVVERRAEERIGIGVEGVAGEGTIDLVAETMLLAACTRAGAGLPLRARPGPAG